MHETMSLELAKQCREELLHEVERNRPVKTLRATRRRRTFWISVLAWEMKRQAGRIFSRLPR